MNRYYTIGVAGHIDHGKTALTKALTGIDTDRLKEEKERDISIEPGFALFMEEDEFEVALIDVPGHEGFIRQMIAGVAGIDMVLMVIAADEGMMPQTKEHLDILTLLGVQHGFIVLTKVDQADPELLEMVVEDIKENMKQTFLEKMPLYLVDSLSGNGILELKAAIQEQLAHLPNKKKAASFRLPIDQVFTVKGQGVVVRGTVYDGDVRQGEQLRILPANKRVRVRQIQRHNKTKDVAREGQRAAINLAGISHEDLSRGDVLAADDFFSVTSRIDVAFNSLGNLEHPIKQRQPIKLHIGTAEVMGKIILFDRNELGQNEPGEILCQLQLDEEIVTARGDRFIIRRPSPVETIGGGWVIEPNAEKYRFGTETIEQLSKKKEGTSQDRIITLLNEKIMLTADEIMKQTAISEKEFMEAKEYLVEVERDLYTLPSTLEHVKERIVNRLEDFHKTTPMQIGMNKAEILAELNRFPAKLIDFTFHLLKKENQIKASHQYISLAEISPSLPPAWEKRLTQVERELIAQGLEVEKWDDLTNKYQIPAAVLNEFYYYLLQTEQAYVFDEERLVSKIAVDEAVQKLKEGTNYASFDVQLARESLQLTRKNLIPLLELLDQLGYTKRVDNARAWVE